MIKVDLKKKKPEIQRGSCVLTSGNFNPNQLYASNISHLIGYKQDSFWCSAAVATAIECNVIAYQDGEWKQRHTFFYDAY